MQQDMMLRGFTGHAFPILESHKVIDLQVMYHPQILPDDIKHDDTLTMIFLAGDLPITFNLVEGLVISVLPSLSIYHVSCVVPPHTQS